MSPFRPFLLPQPRVCSRNQRLLPSYAPRGVNISPVLSTLRILPVATGVYRNPFSLPITEPSSIPFRINTCKSVSKQTTSTPFRIIHLCKTRRGEGLLLTSRVSFSMRPSQCPLCSCLPRPGRGGKSHVLGSLPPLCFSLRSFSHRLPLFSIACRLFYQNTRGGGIPRNLPFGINKIQTFFPDLFATQLSRSPAVSPWQSNLLVYPPRRALCFHNDTNRFSRKVFVLITIQIAPGCGADIPNSVSARLQHCEGKRSISFPLGR